MSGYNYENQGGGYDSGAAGHERQGRAPAPAPLSAQHTITRRDKWIITVEGDKLTIARNEHSDWLEIATTDGQILIEDIQHLIEWARREAEAA